MSGVRGNKKCHPNEYEILPAAHTIRELFHQQHHLHPAFDVPVRLGARLHHPDDFRQAELHLRFVPRQGLQSGELGCIEVFGRAHRQVGRVRIVGEVARAVAVFKNSLGEAERLKTPADEDDAVPFADMVHYSLDGLLAQIQLNASKTFWCMVSDLKDIKARLDDQKIPYWTTDRKSTRLNSSHRT